MATRRKAAKKKAPARRSAPRRDERDERNEREERGGRSNGGGRGRAKEFDGRTMRLTGFFRGKDRGLWTGKARSGRGEEVEKLAELVDNALKEGKDIVCFLREQPGQPEFSVNLKIDEGNRGGGSRGGYSGGRGRIDREDSRRERVRWS